MKQLETIDGKDSQGCGSVLSIKDPDPTGILTMPKRSYVQTMRQNISSKSVRHCLYMYGSESVYGTGMRINSIPDPAVKFKTKIES